MNLETRKAERNREELRKLSQREGNKFCFVCNQRGPLYLVTSFNIIVCSNCAAVHRSLQHKVKGISMCDFTDEEVKSFAAVGNDRAKKVWLAKFSGAHPRPGLDLAIRDFMKKTFDSKTYMDRGAYEQMQDDIASALNPAPKPAPKKVQAPPPAAAAPPAQQTQPPAPTAPPAPAAQPVNDLFGEFTPAPSASASQQQQQQQAPPQPQQQQQQAPPLPPPRVNLVDDLFGPSPGAAAPYGSPQSQQPPQQTFNPNNQFGYGGQTAFQQQPSGNFASQGYAPPPPQQQNANFSQQGYPQQAPPPQQSMNFSQQGYQEGYQQPQQQFNQQGYQPQQQQYMNYNSQQGFQAQPPLAQQQQQYQQQQQPPQGYNGNNGSQQSYQPPQPQSPSPSFFGAQQNAYAPSGGQQAPQSYPSPPAQAGAPAARPSKGGITVLAVSNRGEVNFTGQPQGSGAGAFGSDNHTNNNNYNNMNMSVNSNYNNGGGFNNYNNANNNFAQNQLDPFAAPPPAHRDKPKSSNDAFASLNPFS